MKTDHTITLIEKINAMIRKSVTLKLITITVLMLMLLVPTFMIESIIRDREKLNEEVTREVSEKWSNSQQINGPVLTIPLAYEYNKEGKTTQFTKHWHVLPESLNIEGLVQPEELKRGIYEVVVYKSELDVRGEFKVEAPPDPQGLKEIRYDQAFLTIGISDLRGIKSQIGVQWNGKVIEAKPGSKISELIYSGVSVPLPNLTEKLHERITFDFSLNVKGSQNISFIPLGNSTTVKLRSPWPDPSFNGNFLPDAREIDQAGFTAIWSVLELNRNYPQQWIGNANKKQIQESSFGVSFILPMDDYHRSYRSVRYAAMTISLTFLIFFLAEILNKRKIHPFQYALVGLALCLFYILVVSISEHTSFQLAYAISTLAVILMITLYSISVFRQIRLSIILMCMLCGLYGFLFVTLQLTDYALLMGSVGLSLILALTMYFTRNINWYQLNIGTE